jgi:hypothetical protein
MKGGLGGFLAGMATGYGTVMKFQRENEDDKARAADRKHLMDQRERLVRQQTEDDAIETGAKAAAKPVSVEEQTATDVYESPAAAQGFLVGGQRYADRGVAEKAVAAGNTAEGVNNRVAGFYRSAGKIDRASQIDASTRQAKAADMQIASAERATKLDQGLRDVIGAVARGDAATVTRLYNEQYSDGLNGSAKFNPDGTWTLQQFKPDGTPTMEPMTMTGDQLAARLAATYDPKLFMAAEARKQDQARTDATRAEDRAYREGRDKVGDQFRQDELTIRKNDSAARIDAATARAEASRARAAAAGGAGQGAPVWDEKADAFLRQRYTADDPVTGQVGVDGAGLQFGKALAVYVAQTNGGDTTRALGFAFEKDNELKALAKGDPAKHNALRQQYLQAILSPAAPPGAAPAAAPAAPDKVPQVRDKPGAAATVAAQGLPAPTRGAVGQGRAMLPWEKPEGTF